MHAQSDQRERIRLWLLRLLTNFRRHRLSFSGNDCSMQVRNRFEPIFFWGGGGMGGGVVWH